MSRILVSVADVGGSSVLSWALPCLPVTGMNMGMFTVPPIGAGVWVQFARGDADYPIWLGGYYANGEAPALSRRVPPGVSGITLQTSGGQKIVMNATSIEIDNGMGGTIKMTGPQVSINSGALEVV